MISWRLFKSFPKYAIALGIFVVSTGLFGLWLVLRSKSSKTVEGPVTALAPAPADEKAKEIAEKVKTLPDKIGWLALVGSDLYDISTGEKIFSNWLNYVPEKVFYQPDVNRLMVQTERGLIRFGLDGKQDAAVGDLGTHAFSPDGKQATFVRDGDVWLADIDWNRFALTNERQATRYGKFKPQYFAANVVMGSENALIIRNQPELLRVNLKSGDVQQIRLPLGDVVKRRSPDGRMLIGDARNIYVFDVEAVDAHNFPESRWRAVDFQWLNNERCAFIMASKSASLYSRTTNSIQELVNFPFECSKIVGPSPDGMYVLCAGRKGILILNVAAKTTEALDTPAENFAWVSSDTMIYTSSVPDTSARGTWLKTVGQPARRVMSEPYFVGRNGSGAVDLMRELDVVVFGTKDALFRMKPDGSELKELATLERPAGKIQAVQVWGQ